MILMYFGRPKPGKDYLMGNTLAYFWTDGSVGSNTTYFCVQL